MKERKKTDRKSVRDKWLCYVLHIFPHSIRKLFVCIQTVITVNWMRSRIMDLIQVLIYYFVYLVRAAAATDCHFIQSKSVFRRMYPHEKKVAHIGTIFGSNLNFASSLIGLYLKPKYFFNQVVCIFLFSLAFIFSAMGLFTWYAEHIN